MSIIKNFMEEMLKRIEAELKKKEYAEIRNELASLEPGPPVSVFDAKPRIICKELRDFISSLDSKQKRDEFINQPLIYSMLSETLANKISYDSDGKFVPTTTFKLAYMAYDKMKSFRGDEGLKLASEIAKYCLLLCVQYNLFLLLALPELGDPSNPPANYKSLLSFIDIGICLARIDQLSVFSDKNNHTAYRSLLGKIAIESTKIARREQYADRARNKAKDYWEQGDKRTHNIIGREIYDEFKKEEGFPPEITEQFFIRSIKDIAEQFHRKRGVKKR